MSVKIIMAFISLSIITSGMAVFVLQAINFYHVTPSTAGSLESYMNITRILVSFVMFTILLKFGYKKNLIWCFMGLTVLCFLMPFFDSIWAIRIYLVFIGIATIIIKISVYASVSLVVKNEKEHASFINLMEAIYTLGAISGMWIFAYFIHYHPENWTNAFWVFSGICFIVLLLWWLTPFKDIKVDTSMKVGFKGQVKLFLPIMLSTSMLLFVILFASDEILEQGVGGTLNSQSTTFK